MSTKWTKAEEAALFEAMGGKHIMYAPKAREIAKKLPGRTPEAIRRHWLLIRWNGKPPKAIIPPPQYNPVDVAFTRPITKTDIIRHYRDQGLRGRVTIELGE